jgi:hypothetical protein
MPTNNKLPLVGAVGLEPTLQKDPDFKSGASADSATPPMVRSRV